MNEKKQVNVIKIEVKNDKYGTKKTLTTDTGETYNITTKNKCYPSITSNGLYELTMGEYNGKKVATFAKLIKTANGSATNNIVQSKPSVAMIKTDPDKMAFEKRKQDDIILEYYAGLAKDVLIANGEKKITAEAVMTFAEEFVKIHKDILDGKTAKVREIENLFAEEKNVGTEPMD